MCSRVCACVHTECVYALACTNVYSHVQGPASLAATKARSFTRPHGACHRPSGPQMSFAQCWARSQHAVCLTSTEL